MERHILVISQYFYPEQFRINDICSEWVKRGYKVTVVTGIPNYPHGRYYNGYGILNKRDETYNGVNIVRIPLVPRGNNAIMLVLNYLSFVASGFFWNLFTKIKADYVFIFEVSPMTQALPGVWYARKRKIPCYLYVQDLWPENVKIVAGIKNKYIISAIEKMVRYIYTRCACIFVPSQSFIQSVEQRGVSVDKIHYWPQYAEDFYVPLEKRSIPEIPSDGAFNIIFTGNIGKAQGLDILSKAATLIKASNLSRRIRFNIVGDGRYKSELIEIVNSKGLKDMFNFIPKQPAARIPVFLAASDAAFLSLADTPLLEKTIPAKLQSYMACGIPIIASAAGETAKIIKTSNSGVYCEPGNAEELVKKIVYLSSKTKDELRQMGINARNYYELNFNKTRLLDRMDKYFREYSFREEKVNV